jgi:hypothetical protein
MLSRIAKYFDTSKKTINSRKKARKFNVEMLELERREMPAVYTPGNLVIYQGGDGVVSYNAMAPTYLNELTTTPSQVSLTSISADGAGLVSVAWSGSNSGAALANNELVLISGVGAGANANSALDGTYQISNVNNGAKTFQYTDVPAASLTGTIATNGAFATGLIQQNSIPAVNGTGAQAGNQPVTLDLSAAAGNGQLNRTYDGSALSFGGVDSTINNGGLTAPATPTGQNNRVFGVLSGDPATAFNSATSNTPVNGGTFYNSQTDGAYYVGDDMRGAVGESSVGPFYAVGHPNQAGGAVSQGTHYFPIPGPLSASYAEGPSAGTQSSASTNIRGATIGFDNRLYESTASMIGGAAAVNTAGIFTNQQALPTGPAPANDVQVVPALFGASKLGGVYLADMNGDGIVDNGDMLVFLDDGTVGGAGTGGVYVSVWNSSINWNDWNTNGAGAGGNNAAAVAAGLQDHWSVPVRIGDAPTQTGSGNVGQLRGLTGTVFGNGTVQLYTTAYDNAGGDNTVVQNWSLTSAPGSTPVAITDAKILSTNTVQITTLGNPNWTSGVTQVEVDGVVPFNPASNGLGAAALTGGYNGTWVVSGSGNVWTYTDTNSGASGLAEITNAGAAAATVSGTIIGQVASGSATVGGKNVGDVGERGVAFAPVATTTVMLTQTPANPLAAGSAVTLTASLSNAQVANLQGNLVTFLDENTTPATVLGGGPVLVGPGNLAILTLPSGVIGNHFVQAYFAGGGTQALASARSNTIQIIEQGYGDTLTTVSASPASVATGRLTTLTATVQDPNLGGHHASGTVSFFQGSVSVANLLGTIGVTAGQAVLSTAFNNTGGQTIIAVYNGDNTYESSQGSTTVTVAANATGVLSSSANNVPVGAQPSYTATILGNATLGAPGGTVNFTLTSSTTGAVVGTATNVALTSSGNNSTAQWTGPVLSSPGSYFLTITYNAAGAGPYNSFTIDTISSTSGTALVETAQQAFAPGNLVAVQRGDGNINLGSSGYLVFLDEYTTAGVLVQRVALPNLDAGTAHALLLSGQNGAEGLLNRSGNGYFLTVAGYDVPVGRTFLTSTFPYQFPRTIALVNGSASVDTSTAIGIANPSGSGIAAGIASASASGTGTGKTVTITLSAANYFLPGQSVTISGVSDAAYDSTFTIASVANNRLSFTFVDPNSITTTTPTVTNGLAASPASVPYNPTDVVSQDGKEFWVGSNLPTGDNIDGGLVYVGSVGANTGSEIVPTGTGVAAVGIANGQVYITRPTGDVQAVGTNLPSSPQTTPQTLTSLQNLFTAYSAQFPNAENPEQILLLNTNDGTTNNPNVAYIADQANGLLKFWRDPGTGNWNFGASGTEGNPLNSFGQKLVFAGGVTAVTGNVVNPGASAQIQLYVTGVNVQQQNPNQLDSFLDTHGGVIGSGALAVDNGFLGGNFNLLSFVGGTHGTASPNLNMNFAGLAFAPGFVTDTTLSETGTSAAGYTVTATVTTPSSPMNIPTGVVLFYIDGVLQTQAGSWTLNGSGQATLTIGAGVLSAGTHTINAVYQGDVKDGTSTGTLTWNDPPFTAGNIIATLVGTGAALNGNGTATSVNEYLTAGGAAVQSIALPSGATPSTGLVPFTEKGNNTAEGYLTSSADGHTVTLAGYQAAAGNSTSGTNGEVGVVNPNGSIETSTQIASSTTGGSVKATVSADGLGIWIATGNFVQYVPFGNNALTPSTTVTNWLSSPTTVAIGSANPTASGTGIPGQLFFDGGAGSQSNGIANIDGPVQVGQYSGTGFESNAGLPNVAGQPGTILGFPTARDAFNNFPTSNQIVISPDGNTIFVADSRVGPTDTQGGILEFAQASPGSWTEVGHAQVDNTADGGLRALAGDFTSVPGSVTLYGTTTNTSANRIVKITGGTLNGNVPAFSFTTVETAAANTAFRGVALAPTAAGSTNATTTTLTVTNPSDVYPGTPTGVTLSASVTSAGTPTGYVSFKTTGGVLIGTAPLVSGTATLVPTSNIQVPLNSGNITATYTGDGANAPSTNAAPGTLSVTKDTTTLTLNPAFLSVATGTPDALSAQLTFPEGSVFAAPTGTVTFWQDAVGTSGLNLGTFPLTQTIVNVSGTPTIEYLATGPSDTFTTAGVHHMFAVYSGDGNFQGITGNRDITAVLPSTVTVTSSAMGTTPGNGGVAVTLTATVTGTGATPSGTVAFYDNSLLIQGSVALSPSGIATVVVNTSKVQGVTLTLLPGIQSISAVYSGDSNYFQNSGVYQQAVQATPLNPAHEFVYRVGDGTTNLIAPAGNPNAGTAAIGSTIYVDEIDPTLPDGSNVVQSIILPSADGVNSSAMSPIVQTQIHAIVGNGQQSSTEQLSVSADGNYLFLTGYDNNPLSGATAAGTGIGTTAAAIPTASGSVTRSVARIDLNGNVSDVTMTPANSGSGFGNFNAVFALDGNHFYTAGNGGVVYYSSFSPSANKVTPTATMTSPTGTTTALENDGGNLAIVGAPGFGNDGPQVYSGFPTTPASVGNLTGFSDANAATGGQASTFYIDAYFTHLDNVGHTAPAGINTFYLSDDGPGFAHGAITKWALVGSTWTAVDHITANGTTPPTFYYMAGTTLFEGAGSDPKGAVTLDVTYGNGGNGDTGPGQLYSITDTSGYNAAGLTLGTEIAHVGATSNMVYRGVATFPKTDLTGAGTAVTGTENVPLTNVQVATFTDPDDTVSNEATTNYAATIQWGDGTTSTGTVNFVNTDGGGSHYTVTGTHTYTEDSAVATPYPVTVSIVETGSGPLNLSTTAAIAEQAGEPTNDLTGAGVPVTTSQAQENVSFTSPIATFTDPVAFGGVADPIGNYTVSINWGDGSPVDNTSGALTITNAATGAYSVAGTHTYTESTDPSSAGYPVSVTITETGTGETITLNTHAQVGESLVPVEDLTANGVPVSATQNVPLTNVQVATFHDPVAFGSVNGADPVLEYSVNINWGDTTSSVGTVILTNANTGDYSVTGSHTYTTSGTPTITTSITDASFGLVTTTTSTATVAPAPAPTIVSVTNNAGIAGLSGAQTSRMVSFQVVFSEPVTLNPNAITLSLHTNNVVINGIPVASFGTLPNGAAGTWGSNLVVSSADNITWTITFDPSSTNLDKGTVDGFNSIKDGIYDFNFVNTLITPFGGGANMASPYTWTFGRAFGDITGSTFTNGGTPTTNTGAIAVNNADKLQFTPAFNNPPNYKIAFDVNGDGAINNADKLRFTPQFNHATYTW